MEKIKNNIDKKEKICIERCPYIMENRKIIEKRDRITIITEELQKLGEHIKTYSTGAYSAFYLQSHSILKVKDILDMYLSDVYECDNGNVKVKKEIIWKGYTIELSVENRRELAWYVMQRIKVKNAKEEELKEIYLAVNKQGKQLQKQVYRKILERASNELSLSRVYNSVYLRMLYGYLEIAYGKKTIDDMAKEYQVERYYLLNRIFNGMEIEYAKHILDEVACV